MTVLNRFIGLIDGYSHVYQDYREDVLSLFEPCPGAALLDLGCGDGDFTQKIAARIGTSHVWGIDISGGNVEKARAKSIDCRQSTLDQAKLPFEDESFDVICANQVLEHLADTDTLPKEVHRMLKPGGYAVISIPNLASAHNIFSLILGLQPPQTAISDDFDIVMISRRLEKRTDPWPTHRRAFTQEGLRALLQWHGLSVQETKGSGFYPLPSAAARLVLRFDKRHAAYLSVKARKIQPEGARSGK
jgi:2-polyprenyl-3-methyl-5-hydroxy-6-metoxy-1,4-benzoquinol methylase